MAIKKYMFFVLVILWTTISSQTLNFNQFGIEEGLPQSGIYSMVQDSIGNIWISTMGGVSKYNGLTFENYNSKDGLAENRVVSSCRDKYNNIWFGHWSGGISLYNVNEKKFYQITPIGLFNYKTINYIFCDSKGMLWLATNGSGLLHLNPSSFEKDPSNKENQNTLNVPMIKLNSKDGLNGDIINGICEDDDGNIWVATNNGVNIISIQNGKRSISTLKTPSNNTTSIICDNNDKIWVGTKDIGCIRIDDFKTGRITIYDQSNGLPVNYVNVVFEDNESNIFIGTFGGGVAKYLPSLEKSNYSGPIFQTISTRQGLSNDRILSIIQDREKNIWIGTYLNLNQYFEEQFEIYGNNEGLANSLVWSVTQDKNKNIWMGTDGGLVKFIQGKNTNENKFIYYTYTSSGNSKLKIAATTGLIEDEKGNIWYSSFGNGVSVLNPITRKTINYNENNGLSSNEVFCLAKDEAGNIWMGTNKGGVIKYDVSSEKFTNYITTDGLGSNSVYTIYKDSKNKIWFGVLGGPLTYYDGKSFIKIGEKEGYTNKFTVSITEDINGNMWLGSYDNGIYKYDGVSFRNFRTSEGLTSNTALLLICDNFNNLWIGSGRGVDKLNINNDKIKHYGKQDGFLGVEINPNATYKDNIGNIYFGSIIGLVKYSAAKDRINNIKPITYLKSPLLYFKEWEVPNDHRFKYDENHLTFYFIGASLTNPKRVKYRYMMEGIDTSYSPATKENHITYQNMAPGTYTFKVISANNDGIWNDTPQIFHFTILPPWWKTWWFYLASIVTFILAIYTFFKYRERQLREKNKLLENKVNERTAELRAEKENVEQKNLEINKQKEFIEIQNKNITDSIDYAQRIQAVILPPKEFLKASLNEHFILYKPKNIVSGDFYWASEIEGSENILFAATDCTGHGVPGAFMSIVGNNLLQQAVKEYKDPEPAELLNNIDFELAKVLRKKHGLGGSSKGEVVDAMDMAMIKLDKKKKSLTYSGAKSPVYLVRNKELTILQPTKKSIGIVDTEKQVNYVNQTLELLPNDIIYLFSDGYPDQKGGPNKKKFYYPPFQQLLCEISQKPCDEQLSILDKTITEWIGNSEQIDDIMVIGIKV